MKNVLFVFACLAAVLVASPANGVTINLNIYNPGTGLPNPTLLTGPAGGLGEYWNQDDSTTAFFLLDSTGGATGAGYTSSGTGWGGPDSWSNPSLTVLRDGLRNFDTSATNSQQLVINGLTAGDVYDVWIASANTLGSQRSSGEWWTPNTTTTVGNQLVENIADLNGTSWVQGNNYVLFENVVVDANGHLVFDGHALRDNAYDTRLPLSGFQLVSVEAPLVPEPGALVLLSSGLLGVFVVAARRHRRQS